MCHSNAIITKLLSTMSARDVILGKALDFRSVEKTEHIINYG